MFDSPNTAFLPELLMDITRAKKCRKLSFRKKMRTIDPVCLEQNTIREYLKKNLPKEIKSIEDARYGVDYNYKGITIDQKFSFGALGENTIKIRVQNRELLNNSDWTMIINTNWETEFFPTKKLALFVKKNWGLVQKRLVEKKYEYACYAIRLRDLYALEEISPLKSSIQKEDILCALEKIRIYTVFELANETILKDETSVNDTKRICFEPAIAIIAKQFMSKS